MHSGESYAAKLRLLAKQPCKVKFDQAKTKLGKQGLRSGETKAAVAGGVNVMLAPTTTSRICLLHALSRVGRCRSFDAAGDGYGRGEGFTVALLRYTPA